MLEIATTLGGIVRTFGCSYVKTNGPYILHLELYLPHNQAMHLAELCISGEPGYARTKQCYSILPLALVERPPSLNAQADYTYGRQGEGDASMKTISMISSETHHSRCVCPPSFRRNSSRTSTLRSDINIASRAVPCSPKLKRYVSLPNISTD